MSNKASIHFAGYNSPCGRLMVGIYDRKICMCDWVSSRCFTRNKARISQYLKADFTVETGELPNAVKICLDEYFVGLRTEFNLPLLTVGTDFQQRVWNALTSVPYGSTISYKTLAGRVDRPHAIRAVANAVGANAISIFIPCHRIIGSNGTLTGYAGGLGAKRFLLELEQR